MYLQRCHIGTKNLKWKKAMDEEIESLHRNQTWELIQLPKGKKTIGCKWVYAEKDNNSGVKFKARLVAKGHIATFRSKE